MGLFILLWCAWFGAAAPAVQIQVSPRLALAPTDVRVLVRIAPDARNRALRIALDGPNYYRASTIPLEGEEAPRLLERWYPAVRSPGRYLVSAEVVRADRTSARAEVSMCLFGTDETACLDTPSQ